MTKEEFNSYFEKAVNLGVGIISFLGGEPMLWPHLYYAIDKCSKRGIITEMTTNGTFLSDRNLEKLGLAGLDILGLSVDSLTEINQSNKNLLNKSNFVNRLEVFRKKYKTHININAVITRDNVKNIEKLVDFIQEMGCSLSLGFVMPPLFKNEDYEGASLLFVRSDFLILKEIVEMILNKKKNGYRIIDPDSYFEGIFDFINGNNSWNCKLPRKAVSGITIAPNGRLRTCSKLMDYLDYNFLDLTPQKIKDVRNHSMKIIDKCNPYCYSNCQYASFYYNSHKFEFLIKQVFPAIKELFKV